MKICGDVWRYVEICGNLWRCVEICGDVCRYVEMCGDKSAINYLITHFIIKKEEINKSN